MKSSKLFFLVLLCSTFTFAQVGVNIPANTSVNSSAAFEIQSGSSPKGMLTPRMTSAERIGITTPANGLLVFDMDIKAFHYYDTTTSTWIRINSDVNGRTNFKRLKSTDVLATVLAAELSDGGGTKYKLKTNTLYEINGTVTLDKPIELNNAYIQGVDSGDDILVSAGNIFDGITGGTVKGLTVRSVGGKVFNLSGANTENFIFRDCIVANSSNVGSINGFGLVFISVVQFSGNTAGITYSNINQLLLSNLGWFGNNAGTFEKLTGTFKLVQKQGGFSEVNGAAVGFDVSGNPTISGDAVMENVVFTGTLTTGAYVNGYTTGSYTGYNFNNKWNVRSAGIPVETDAVAVGDVNLDSPYGTGVTTALTTGTAVKVGGTTVSNNFFRASNGGVNNKLVYLGNKKRFFTVNSVASFRGTAVSSTIYVFYIALNGVPVQRSKTYIFTTNSADVVAVPIQSILELSPNDFVEVFVQRFSGSSDMLTVSLSLFMR
ncbi:hypothetical protein [Chryseobacterium sp. MP_3.2]|uniref:hypothetical protein n=1 Tax=Chryseobacterium sp. MP_3.2 TaxID=3071712 RepID=UPI002E1342B6